MADQIANDIFAWVREGSPAVSGYITTVTSDAAPSVRQVSTFVEDGWTTGIITEVGSLKARHIERNPNVAVLWVDRTGKHRSRQVTLVGKARVETDLDQVNAFLARRRAVYSAFPIADVTAEAPRHLIVIEPVLLRAEGFVDGKPNLPLVIRDFDALTVTYPFGSG
jgi:general stress protein 26